MSQIKVTAGRTLLEGYVKSPPVGICELVWNAFDEDAKLVSVEVESGPVGGIELIRVRDDGNGMTRERAELAFSRVGDSWKMPVGTTSAGGRPVHGKFGRGRYSAFSLGAVVQWTSTSEAVEGGALATIQVRGSYSSLDQFEIDDVAVPETESGTRVEAVSITPEAANAFEEREQLRQRLLTEFALHLERHEDFSIEFLGSPIDPSTVVQSRTPISLTPLEGVEGEATLTVIEWKLSNVERRLYLCNTRGVVVDQVSPNIQAVGAEFTAYVEWDGFAQDEAFQLAGNDATPAGKVINAARTALKDHLAQASRRREAETVKRWKAEGVYPYKKEPANDVEKATRDTFNLVAMAASRTVDESKTISSKALALGLLKETFENDPEALLPILRKFSQLPAARIDELREILEHTTLTQLIAMGKEVGDRIEFVTGLNALLFDRATKKRLLERRQLHRILAHETWIFGEEWSLTGDDERLTEVLKKFLGKLGENVDLVGGKPVLREDGSDAIPDLVLGRRLETRANHFAHLVVELKRPRHKLTDEDVSQLRSYASAITNDERFDQPNTSWEFWLVGNETTNAVDEQREQDHLPFGVVQSSKKYRLIVRTWAEVLGDAEHRLKFVQNSLQFESTRDTGLASMRDKYADYLPKEAFEELESMNDFPSEPAILIEAEADEAGAA
ncbi:ATP-binding protein [Microbacterium invictum]|uniref:ATP-binding protein n=1 Tax=Microbacterium invictum TaxID=515415 RepID=A0ABZ0VEE9_9MICO|nr:ATP-binding protein [Microbacterium invictum]WQB70515.1 ATP-binding protein [Microbacterium invictum]